MFFEQIMLTFDLPKICLFLQNGGVGRSKVNIGRSKVNTLFFNKTRSVKGHHLPCKVVTFDLPQTLISAEPSVFEKKGRSKVNTGRSKVTKSVFFGKNHLVP